MKYQGIFKASAQLGTKNVGSGIKVRTGRIELFKEFQNLSGEGGQERMLQKMEPETDFGGGLGENIDGDKQERD